MAKAELNALAQELREIEVKVNNVKKVILQDARLDIIREELLLMQTRKNEIEDVLLNVDSNELFKKEDIIKILSQDRKRLSDLDAEALFKRYINKIHALNGMLSLIGGVYSDSPSIKALMVAGGRINL